MEISKFSVDMAGLVTSTTQQNPSTGNQISLSSESSSGENDDKNCSMTLIDPEAFDCPICCDALTSKIYQCDNGHIACSTCCKTLRNKCPSCDSPVGHIRCRAMERVMKAVIVPCPNVKLGCTKKFSYGKELTHEKKCAFSRCYCPAENCDYTGSYKDLSSHFDIHKVDGRYNYQFLFGKLADIYFELTEYTSVVLKEYESGLLFVVQCFSEPHGINVAVSCTAPSALEVGEFSSYITTIMEPRTIVLFPKVKRVRKLRLETPEKDFMLVPSYFLRGRQGLMLRIYVNKSNPE